MNTVYFKTMCNGSFTCKWNPYSLIHWGPSYILAALVEQERLLSGICNICPSIFLLLNKTSYSYSLRKAAVAFLNYYTDKDGCPQKYCSMHYGIIKWVNFTVSKQCNTALFRGKLPYKWFSKAKSKQTNFKVNLPQLFKDIMWHGYLSYELLDSTIQLYSPALYF